MRKILFAIFIGICTLSSLYAQQRSINVTGTITDDSGEPLSGVTIALKNTNVGVVSGATGTYNITVQGSEAVLIFSYVGFTTQEITVGNRTVIDVTLVEGQELGEVVVTALGITKEAKALGYAVSTISAKELTKVGSPNFGAALYGKASGVRIQSSTGGNTSSVSVTVRGLNSLTGNTQPLLVVDGVPVRNGNVNNDGTWDGDRIYSNGLVDINPEDIDQLSILKGAAASALYGSEAANGVLLVTTKKGKKGAGLGVEFNATIAVNKVAYMPKVQTTFGPGRAVGNHYTDYEKQSGGFAQIEYKGNTYERVEFGGSHDYGLRYDGRDVLYWDGSVRKYEAITDSPYTDLFRTGVTQTYNVALTSGGEKSNSRFSYTFVDEMPNQFNSSYNKHNFQLAGTHRLNDNLAVDYTANYIRQNVYNRARNIGGMIDNMSNQFTSFDDIALMRKKAVTSLGYRGTNYVGETARSLTPDENFAYNNPSDAFSYYWSIFGNEQFESNNRLIASVAPSWQIIKGLTLRGRISTDLTANAIERKSHTETPLIYRITDTDKTGGYMVRNESYNIYYGDIMLMFDRNLSEKINLTANLGWQGRTENALNSQVSTRDGLSTENWFHLNASVTQPGNSSMDKSELLKTAFFGSAGISYLESLYFEATLRQEKTSTLAPGNNAFFYPSVNASFVFTDMFRDAIPAWYNYGKVRASYGIVGNAPDIYRANVAYNQSSLEGIAYNTIPGSIGNDNIKPETKYEWEFGLESKFFDNRISFEVSYYTNKVEDQILPVQTINSIGGSSLLQNVGVIANKGLEISLRVRPVQTRDFSWDVFLNYGFNRGKVVSLADGSDILESNARNQNMGGCVTIQSRVGQQMGDIMVYAPERDPATGKILVYSDGGNAGLNVVKYGKENLDKAGNAIPTGVGGIGTSLAYKNLYLDAMFDFRIGGYVVSDGYQYTMARGINVNSLAYRDEQNGGKAYYFPGNSTGAIPVEVSHSTASGPNGEWVYHDGMIVDGIKADADGNSSGQANDIIVPASRYYNWTYNVGNEAPTHFAFSVFDNSYLKLRELSLGYRLPGNISSKFGCKNLSLSVFGRNLFYFFKNKSGYDAETTSGTSWQNQIFLGTATTASTRTFGVSLRASF
ncbi:MAG: SusC/RagA family TonB-linked outer membrane protein [Prevotella sp.]|nr:SusC/RagA family TonB-linked outer membrane protein [Prevotella sp.]